MFRPGGRVAVSVNTVVERSYNHQINVMIARHMSGLAEAVTRTFALGEESRLYSVNEAGLVDIETHTVGHTFVLPSFDAYYGPFERGGAPTGQALAALPEEIRRAVREEVRRDLADRGGLSRRRQSIASPVREGSGLLEGNGRTSFGASADRIIRRWE